MTEPPKRPHGPNNTEYRVPYDKSPYNTETRDPHAPSLAPRRKILAGTGGSSVGSLIAVVLAYHLPDAPPEVVVAYSGLLIVGSGFLLSYFVPEG